MGFDDLLIHTVTVEPYLGDGPMGATYGPSRQIKARVELASAASRQGQIGMLNYKARIFVPANEPIIENSRLTWIHPVTLMSVIWQVIVVGINSDRMSVHHQEIYVQ